MFRAYHRIFSFLISLNLVWVSNTRAVEPFGDELATYRQAVLKEKGDPSRGRRLYEKSAQTQCKNCHSISGKGTMLGPDFTGMSQHFDRAGLLESILNPSARIHPDYCATVIVTGDGRTLTGMIRQVGKNLEIVGSDTKTTRVASEEVEHRSVCKSSLMPTGLHRSLTPREMASLISFIEQLKTPASNGIDEFRAISQIPTADEKQFVPLVDEKRCFDRPVWFGSVTGMNGMNAVAELQSGRVWLQPLNGGERSLFVDIKNQIFVGDYTGLMSVAFYPEYMKNGRYFLKYHTIDEAGGLAVDIVERTASDDRLSDSGQPAKLIIKIPLATDLHYGGDLLFGTDGFLYFGMGDSGPQGDPHGHAQDLSVLWGKILRLDVDTDRDQKPYSIPLDNPFRERAGARPEIWAYGFRQPWRISFDPYREDLWVGDVGQNLYEEVTIVRQGENHGWNVFEGLHKHSDQYSSKDAYYVSPLFVYYHELGLSITGGFVYQGKRNPELEGKYICGDFVSRRVWAVEHKNRRMVSIQQIGRAPERISSFGLDDEGEIYVVGFDHGQLYRIEPATIAR